MSTVESVRKGYYAQTLSNLQTVCDGLVFIANLKRTHKRYIVSAQAAIFLAKAKSKAAARKYRYQKIFEARERDGRSFREIGEMFGITSNHANVLYHRAGRLAERGWLYTTGRKILEHEVIVR